MSRIYSQTIKHEETDKHFSYSSEKALNKSNSKKSKMLGLLEKGF